MAKVLKFGLMLDDCNVRSLEGLQEHFVIEDVLKYFEDGTLSRWLKVWGYKEQLAEVEAIDKTLDKKDIALQLAHIFGIENVDAADIEKALSVFSYLDKKQKFQVTVQENALFKKQAVEEYLASYEALIQDMITKGCQDRDVDAFREDVQKLEQDYLPLVKLSFSELYFRLKGPAPRAILAMSGNKTLKKLFKRCPACVKEDYGRLIERAEIKPQEHLDKKNADAPSSIFGAVGVVAGNSAANGVTKSVCNAMFGGGGGGGCYITTATCEEYGKSDNCYELTMFRSFRDTWLRKQPDGEQLIKRYYATAPALVELINKQPNRRAIYRHLNEAYLSKCLRYIEDGENIKCKELYVDMVEFLYGEQQKWQN